MKVVIVVVIVVVGAMVAGCGVPAGAGRLARSEVAVLAEMPGDESGVRAELLRQAEAWGALQEMLVRRELFGVPVEVEFVELVGQTADLARREKELIEAGKDDGALNRRALERMRGMWTDVLRYLGG